MPQTPKARHAPSLQEKAIQEAGYFTNAQTPPASPWQAALTYTPDRKYSIGQRLGEGAHGTVHTGTDVETGNAVAIKIVPVQNIKEAAVECTTQGIMRHPNIVDLQETIVDLDGRRVFLVMELCRGGELFDIVAEVGKLEE